MQKISEIFILDNDDQVKLKQSFVDACKSSRFRDFIKTIPASEEVLIKYTSSLEDASLEFFNCSNCPGVEACQNKMQGFVMKPIVSGNTIHFDYVACSYLQKQMKETAYLSNIELFQISKSLKNASIRNIQTNDKERLQVLRYFKSFLDHYDDLEKPKGIYLNGSFGTGKTYLIAALFNELARRGVKSAIVYYPEFLRSLKESFDTDYKEKFHYIRRVPILLLDDIGAEGISAWSRDEILGSILQYRMEENLPTFFTSNLTLEELEEHLSISSHGVEKVKARRIVERIQYMTIDMKLISKNRRNTKE